MKAETKFTPEAALEMFRILQKLSAWLKDNAAILEDAAERHGGFPSVATDELADAKNYRATAKHIDAVLAKADGGAR